MIHLNTTPGTTAKPDKWHNNRHVKKYAHHNGVVMGTLKSKIYSHILRVPSLRYINFSVIPDPTNEVPQGLVLGDVVVA